MVRMAHEADVADIVAAFQNQLHKKLPSFGATNFDRVPMHALEHMEHAAVRDWLAQAAHWQAAGCTPAGQVVAVSLTWPGCVQPMSSSCPLFNYIIRIIISQ